MINLKRITDLQLHITQHIGLAALDGKDKIKFGKTLVSNYKKAKAIVNSGTDHVKYWTQVLEYCKFSLNELVVAMETECMMIEEISPSTLIGYFQLISDMKYLDFEDSIQYGGGDEDNINWSNYEDLTYED